MAIRNAFPNFFDERNKLLNEAEILKSQLEDNLKKCNEFKEENNILTNEKNKL